MEEKEVKEVKEVKEMVESRICSRCKKNKHITEFKETKTDWTKNCIKCLERKKKSREKNSEKNKQKIKQYQKENKEKIKQYQKQYQKQYHKENSEKFKQYKKQYRKDEKHKCKEHNKDRQICKICNPLGHLINLERSRQLHYLTKGKCGTRTLDNLGCSIEEWKIHLENQFDENMNWDNFGTYWEIDHYVPLLYGINKPPTKEMIIQRLHYTNTQPMQTSKNISKGNRYIG